MTKLTPDVSGPPTFKMETIIEENCINVIAMIVEMDLGKICDHEDIIPNDHRFTSTQGSQSGEKMVSVPTLGLFTDHLWQMVLLTPPTRFTISPSYLGRLQIETSLSQCIQVNGTTVSSVVHQSLIQFLKQECSIMGLRSYARMTLTKKKRKTIQNGRVLLMFMVISCCYCGSAQPFTNSLAVQAK